MLDIKKSPTARSRAVRPIGYFAVLQDAEQISVPAVHYADTKRIPPELRCGSLGGTSLSCGGNCGGLAYLLESTQFSILMSLMFRKSFAFSVTSTIFLATAVQPISRSNSPVGVPARANRAFSAA